MNPLDTFALEEAVRIRESEGGEVVALSMGPPQAVEVLREAVALGADRAVLLSDRELAGSDTLATSYVLARAIQNDGGADIVICGKQAIDGDRAQVGPGIAAHLDIPQLTYVRKIRDISSGRITAECMTDTGYDVLSASIPVLMTVVKELNDPRLPSLSSLVGARRMDISVLSAADAGIDPARAGLSGSPTRVKHIHTPDRTKETRMLSDDPARAAEELLEELKNRKICSK